MALLGDRDAAAAYSPLPVNDLTVSTDIIPVTGETVAVTAGAAGTGVVSFFAKAPIYNTIGSRIANESDSSISWTTGTVFTTEVGMDYRKLERLHAGKKSSSTIVTQMTSGLANGEYMVDYENGVLYGVKATAATSDTAAYNVRAITTTSTSPSGGTSITTSEAATLFFDADADNVKAAMKASPGTLSSLDVFNSNPTNAYVQMWNLATGDVTVGATAPHYVLLVPANGGALKEWTAPLDFTVAITYACTTTPTGSGDPTTGLVVNGAYI